MHKLHKVVLIMAGIWAIIPNCQTEHSREEHLSSHQQYNRYYHSLHPETGNTHQGLLQDQENHKVENAGVNSFGSTSRQEKLPSQNEDQIVTNKDLPPIQGQDNSPSNLQVQNNLGKNNVYLRGPQNTSAAQNKTAKFLSLFTIVRFRAFTCNASNEQGICLTTIGCSNQGGTQIGTCAQGWGVCCRITKSTCGSTVDTNCTYIQNPSYPGSESGSQSCCYNIKKCASNICWLRLDMIKNTIAEPNIDATNRETNGDCLIDRMSTTCSTGTRFPSNFCGTNDGQHAYLDVCMVDECQICFNLGSGTANERSWRIKISQIECDNVCAPPAGCLQYYKGNEGTFCNFGFRDTTTSLHLADQEYSICFRMEKNKCSITYTVSSTVTNNWNLSPPAGQAGVGDNCNADYLVIALARGPSSTTTEALLCGQRFAVTDLSTTNEPITTSAKPFAVHYFTNSIEGSSDQNGFCLDYVQNDC